MKKIAFFSITLLLACMAGCDNKIPMEENLWPETVYLVGAKDKIINRDLNIGCHQRFAACQGRCNCYC